MLPKVLVVEDDAAAVAAIREKLAGMVEVLTASTLADAYRIARQTPDFVAVACDGLVPQRMFDEPSPTVSFVEFLRNRQSFTGHILAMSSEKSLNGKLVQAGCNHVSTKSEAPRLLLQLLELAPPGKP